MGHFVCIENQGLVSHGLLKPAVCPLFLTRVLRPARLSERSPVVIEPV